MMQGMYNDKGETNSSKVEVYRSSVNVPFPTVFDALHFHHLTLVGHDVACSD